MKLSKPMLEIFARVARGTNTIESLAVECNKSPNWITEIAQELEIEGFIIKKKSYKIQGSRLVIEIANTNHAIKLKELLFQYKTIQFENILSDSKLLFLAAINEDWMSIEIASKLSRVSKYMIERYRPLLKSRGIIIKKNKLYKVNEKAWPHLKDFLTSYRNYTSINGYVRWKYQDEILFEVDNKSLINGSITGFAKYRDYGIKINIISTLCKMPETKVPKEEIFVHSLFEINDSRTLNLALTFYIKNNINCKKVLAIAMKYGKYTLFTNFIKLLKADNNLKLEGLPEFNKNDFNRIASMYGVKNV